MNCYLSTNFLPMDLLKLLLRSCDPGTVKILTFVSGGMYSLVRTFFPETTNIPMNLCMYGAICGKLNIIKWAIEIGHNYSSATTDEAAENDHLR